MLVVAAAAGGALVAAVYGRDDGLLIAGLLLLCGIPVIALSHLLAHRQRRIQSLSTKFTAGVALAIGLVLAGVGVVASLMFVSAHDAVLMAVLLVFAGLLAAYSASLLARGVIEDIRRVRDGLTAVGRGERDDGRLGRRAAAAPGVARVRVPARRRTRAATPTRPEGPCP
jgi:hypothetical protein